MNPQKAGQRGVTRRRMLEMSAMGLAGAILSACKGAPASQVVKETVEVVKEVEKVVTPTASPSVKRTKLRIGTSYPLDQPNMVMFTDEIGPVWKEQHPGMDLELSFVPVWEVARNFVQTLAVGEAPDFFYSFESQGTLAYLDHLYDVTDLLKEEGVYDDLYQGAINLWSFNGRMVGVPEYFGTKCYVYRADVFEEVGLDPDKFPETWEEFREAAIKLTKRDESGKIIRDGYWQEDEYEHLIMHMHQNGGGEFSGDEAIGPAAINAPEALEAFTWFIGMVRDDQVRAKEGSATPPERWPAADGYAGIEYMGPWWMPGIREGRPELVEAGLIRVAPPLKRKKQVGHLDACGWSVNKRTEILQETLDFVKLFLKDENYAKFMGTSTPSSRKSINSSPDFWIAKEPLVRDTAFYSSLDTGESTARKHLGFNEAVTYVYPRIIEQGYWGVKPDQAILDWAAGQMDAITEKVKSEFD